MSNRLLMPSPELERRWGPLAYVSEAERQRIIDLPAGQAKLVTAALEREIAAFLKKRGGQR